MSNRKPSRHLPGRNEILLLPLGGTGEIGMNLTLYGHDGAWIAVDLGITFGGDAFPEHDVMMADPAFIEAQRGRLSGLLLTHGHEDHIGALPFLWRQLKCPIHATPFTAALARMKLVRAGLEQVPLQEVALDESVRVGPFDVQLVTMTHSIPEPNGLLIGTPAGAVFHTGDWKLDDHPVVERSYDRQRLYALRHAPLLAMVCDSTNALVPGHTGPESTLLKPLCELAGQATGRLLVTSFASNIARLVTLARVAEAVGRRFGVVGQAMERMVSVARATGYWPNDLPGLVDSRHLGYLPPAEVLAACTGSQGEPRSALVRIATDMHRDLLLEPGDTVIFSSKLIPGNERPVGSLQKRLRALGVEVITDDDAEVHVSGHPAREDLRRLYQWVQPPLVIPVHGTPRHLAANAEIATRCHVPQVRVIGNGDLVSLTHEGATPIGNVETGRLSTTPNGRLRRVPADLLARMRAQAGEVPGHDSQDQSNA